MKLKNSLWELGFRPFFLLAALFAIVAIAAWLSIFLGATPPPLGHFDPISWHAHEMIYGYTTAVIAGFVLTASQNWTGLPGIHGRKLLLLVLLWTLGRVAIAFPILPQIVIAVIDLSFYPWLAATLFPYLKPADMKVERVFFLYFGLYFLGNFLMHFDSGSSMRGALLGLHTTLLMIIFMGGRLIPFFAESERAKNQPETYKWIEVLSHITAWAFLASQFFNSISIPAAAIAFFASAVHGVRLIGWSVRRVRRVALLWVLYLAYFWIAVGFFLSGLTSLGILALGLSVHALTVGGLGLMTYGIMSRVALGHTGRKLFPSKWVITGFLFLNSACVFRVLGPIFFPSAYNEWIALSGVFWIVAFAVFVAIYAPMLFSPRADANENTP